MTEAPQITLKTFGCRLNLWESEVMRDLARDAGLNDVVIINTCTVTSEAERQARQAIRRAHRENPETKIVVTGCAAQLSPEKFSAMSGVTRVLGNGEKLDPAAWRSTEKLMVRDAAGLRETAHHLVDGFLDNTRGFVQVQQGCDHRCTFCIIPLARGPSRSVALPEIIEAVERLVATGHRDVVLTGVDLTSWGGDLPGTPTLGQLVRQLLLAVPGLPRLRLSSIDPAEIDETLWDMLGNEPRLMPHLHFSAQAGDDLILKQMKRRHSRGDLLKAAEKARRLRPDIAFGADLIAGFPTESDAQFQNTLDLVTEAGLDYLHVFPYSPRPGTPAARLKSLPQAVVTARAATLRALGRHRHGEILRRLVGTTQQVLMERKGIGRTPGFAPVRPIDPAIPGTIQDLHLTGIADDCLTGVVS